MKTLEQRFWEKVDKRSDNECWEWIGANDYSYGLIRVDKNKIQKAHRVSWIIHNKIIPSNKQVCHTCDNRRCVNPRHLWLGNQSENMIDCSMKNRSNKPKGSKNTASKLTEEEVIEIRQMYSTNKYSQRFLAKLFFIDQTVIGDIVRREIWKHV